MRGKLYCIMMKPHTVLNCVLKNIGRFLNPKTQVKWGWATAPYFWRGEKKMNEIQIKRIVYCMNKVAGNLVFRYDEKEDTIYEYSKPVIRFAGFNYDVYWNHPREFILNDMEVRHTLERYNEDWMLELTDEAFYGVVV